jgi:hypothetical protein
MRKLYISCKMGNLLHRRYLLVLLWVMFMGTATYGQQILFVNDNDFIDYNTDTIINDLNNTTYSGYHYWNIPDSGGSTPSAVFMNTFDLVIWYCSTDGVGLKIWDASSTSGNSELESYVAGGKRLWIIGQDMLYQKYTTGTTFTAGEFAKDYMGLTSYDVQSYADDGSMGCPQMDKVATASTLFPAMLKWQFSTLWYADGCTPSAGVKQIYQMGPATYSLNGRKSMFHNDQGGVSVMSTLFDPALIDTFVNRVAFLQQSITYILGTASSPYTLHSQPSVRVYPNPATNEYNVAINALSQQNVLITLTDVMGRTVAQQYVALNAGSNVVSQSVAGMAAGMYLLSIKDTTGQTLYAGKLQKK